MRTSVFWHPKVQGQDHTWVLIVNNKFCVKHQYVGASMPYQHISSFIQNKSLISPCRINYLQKSISWHHQWPCGGAWGLEGSGVCLSCVCFIAFNINFRPLHKHRCLKLEVWYFNENLGLICFIWCCCLEISKLFSVFFAFDVFFSLPQILDNIFKGLILSNLIYWHKQKIAISVSMTLDEIIHLCWDWASTDETYKDLLLCISSAEHLCGNFEP